jgi:hypothetical protein
MPWVPLSERPQTAAFNKFGKSIVELAAAGAWIANEQCLLGQGVPYKVGLRLGPNHS